MRSLKVIVVLVLAACLSGAPYAGNKMLYGKRFVVLYPSADGTISNWTTSGGNHFGSIDDATDAAGQLDGDGDSTYIDGIKTADSTAIFDLTNSADYAVSFAKIRFLQVLVEGKRNNDSGSGTLLTRVDPFWRVSSTNYTAGQATLSSTSYTEITNLARAYVNPATSLPWTASDVDALQLYVERDHTGSNFRFDARTTSVAVVVVYDVINDTPNVQRIRGSGQ